MREDDAAIRIARPMMWLKYSTDGSGRRMEASSTPSFSEEEELMKRRRKKRERKSDFLARPATQELRIELK